MAFNPFRRPRQKLAGPPNPQIGEHGLHVDQTIMDGCGREPLHRNQSFFVTPEQVPDEAMREFHGGPCNSAHIQQAVDRRPIRVQAPNRQHWTSTHRQMSTYEPPSCCPVQRSPPQPTPEVYGGADILTCGLSGVAATDQERGVPLQVPSERSGADARENPFPPENIFQHGRRPFCRKGNR